MFLNLLHLVVSIRNVSTIAMYCNSIVLFKPTIVIAIVLFNNSNTSIHCNTFHTIAMDNTLLTIPGMYLTQPLFLCCFYILHMYVYIDVLVEVVQKSLITYIVYV